MEVGYYVTFGNNTIDDAKNTSVMFIIKVYKIFPIHWYFIFSVSKEQFVNFNVEVNTDEILKYIFRLQFSTQSFIFYYPP